MPTTRARSQRREDASYDSPVREPDSGRQPAQIFVAGMTHVRREHDSPGMNQARECSSHNQDGPDACDTCSRFELELELDIHKCEHTSNSHFTYQDSHSIAAISAEEKEANTCTYPIPARCSPAPRPWICPSPLVGFQLSRSSGALFENRCAPKAGEISPSTRLCRRGRTYCDVLQRCGRSCRPDAGGVAIAWGSQRSRTVSPPCTLSDYADSGRYSDLLSISIG